MPAFTIDLGTGRTTDTALYDSNRAFPVDAAKTWNSLPSEVTSLSCLQSSRLNSKPLFFGLFPMDDCKLTDVLGIFQFKF